MAASLRAPSGMSGRALSGRTLATAPARRVAVLPPARLAKGELKELLRDELNLTRKDADAAVEFVLNKITEAVARGEDVVLTGFGTFKRVERSARTGRNPQTGEALNIPAKKAPAFTAGKNFKEAVNGDAAPKKK